MQFKYKFPGGLVSCAFNANCKPDFLKYYAYLDCLLYLNPICYSWGSQKSFDGARKHSDYSPSGLGNQSKVEKISDADIRILKLNTSIISPYN